MKVKQILSKHYMQNDAFWHIVYEWEDVLKEELRIPIITDCQYPIIGGLLRRFPFISRLFPPYKTSFSFELGPWKDIVGRNKPNIVPCIIDFFLKDPHQLQQFYSNYNKHKVVLVSSLEVKTYLKEVQCPLPIEHLGLSLSDKYRITTSSFWPKEYDVILMGRTNPVLKDFLNQYSQSHSISIVQSQKQGHDFVCYTDDGQYVGKASTRDEYMHMLRKGRVFLYSTPGLDGGEKRTHGFNQVTPKFLEALACGCHVLMRYIENPDTKFYELDKYWPNISTYEEFEGELDKALSSAFNYQFASSYLNKHYTSVRVKELVKIIDGINS